MTRSRSMTIAFAAVMILVASMTAALATHEDVIVEQIPVSDVEIGLEPIADGFTSPVWAINAPGDNHRLFVVDQVGTITAIKLDPGNSRNIPDRLEFLDVGASGLDLLVPMGAFGPGSFDERGLLGLAFHPDYRKNGLIYTYTSEPVSGPADFSTMPDGVTPNHQTVIREWHVADPKRADSVVDSSSSRVLLTIDQPQFNHNGGAVNFGPDGMLYIAVGDGGAADDQGDGHAVGGNGQDLSDGNVLGKILRIDPGGQNSANGEYGIPADNSFIDREGADEIYAYGFRNPYRFSFDTHTGKLIAADVGQNDIEEVDIVVSGGNYGWPVKEGSFVFDMNGADRGFTTEFSPGIPAGMIDPIAEYDHDEGISITGGFVYRGNRVKNLRDSYVFGDWLSRLFHLTEDGSIAELKPIGQELGVRITGFGQDREGELYVLGQPGFAPVGTDGVVMRIVEAEHPRDFTAELVGAAEIPPVDSDAGGEASFKVNGDRTQVRFELEVEDIEGVVQAHIHVGPADENGPVVAFLFGPESGGIDVAEEETIARGILTESDLRGPLTGMTIGDLLSEMERGNAYVNVHTLTVPSGEIRGQIVID